jgi:hypothetical protein
MRLGAPLAARACQELSVKTLLLWDPVVSGSDYLRELELLERRRNVLYLHGSKRKNESELFGFRLSNEQRSAITAIDLCSEPLPRAERIVVAATTPEPPYTRLQQSLSQRGASATLRVVEGAGPASGAARVLLSNTILSLITEELQRAAS